MTLLEKYALSFLGTPYRWAGDDPMEGMDCSGFVQELLASVGVDPQGDQNAQGLYNALEPTATQNVYKLGSIAFFGASVTKITHVAMLLDAYRMIEAGGGGAKTLTLGDAARANAYIRIRLIKNRRDLVAILRPSYSGIGVIS